jgi:hypothetical protein
MMTSPVAGIDPHQDTITVGIVDANGVELTHATFPASAAGYLEAIELLSAHGVEQVGIEGSAGWGAHAAVALVAAGFDAREVPAQRSAAQRRSRRLDKTDVVDAVAAARALLAEPSLGPVQRTNIAHGTVLVTDGETSYPAICCRLQIRHEPINLVATRRSASEALPAVHHVASLLRRWIAGVVRQLDGTT